MNEYKNKESMQESRDGWHWSRVASPSAAWTKEGRACIYSSPEALRTTEKEMTMNGLPQDRVNQRQPGQAYVLWKTSHFWFCWLILRDLNQEFETWMLTERTIIRCPAEVCTSPTNLWKNSEHFLSKDGSSLISWCWQVVKLNVSQTTSFVGEWFHNP